MKKKLAIVDILNEIVYIDEKSHYVNNAIGIYSRSVFDALTDNDVASIRFYRNEL